MFEGHEHPYDANTVLAGAATNTPGRTGIWAPIERAKQLAICSLAFLLLMHWNVREKHTWTQTKYAKPPKGIAWRDNFLDLAETFEFSKGCREQ